jgi:hypothetical protein
MIRSYFSRTGWLLLALLFLLYTSHASAQPPQRTVAGELMELDQTYFSAVFGKCDMATVEKILHSDFQFLQVGGGTAAPKKSDRKQFIENLRKNFCQPGAPTMRRELIGESVQVTPVAKAVVMQLGVQKFYLSVGGREQLVETSRFSRIWVLDNNAWKISQETDFQLGGSAIAGERVYVPDDKELYNTIVKMDSVLFDAYDNCKLDVSEAMYSDSIEFYHDRGGLLTSKKILIESLKNNICGRVTRRLVKGSIEVYPVPNFGAIEIGEHGFDNKLEPDAPKTTARFIIIWQYKEGKWFVSLVLSLH